MVASRSTAPRPEPWPDAPAHEEAAETDDAADRAIGRLARSVAQGRRAAGLTLAALAHRARVSTAYISQIESATANPTVRSLAQLSAAMGTTLGELFGGAPDDRLPTPRFEPRFATTPRAARAAGVEGIWDLTATGSGRINTRLVRGAAGDHASPISHRGEEFVSVLAGSCELHVGGLVRDLKAFDACHFAAEDPHHIARPSDDLLLLVVLSGD
jgi:transcriptional regulator with XRE-family HTH domain